MAYDENGLVVNKAIRPSGSSINICKGKLYLFKTLCRRLRKMRNLNCWNYCILEQNIVNFYLWKPIFLEKKTTVRSALCSAMNICHSLLTNTGFKNMIFFQSKRLTCLFRGCIPVYALFTCVGTYSHTNTEWWYLCKMQACDIAQGLYTRRLKYSIDLSRWFTGERYQSIHACLNPGCDPVYISKSSQNVITIGHIVISKPVKDETGTSNLGD